MERGDKSAGQRESPPVRGNPDRMADMRQDGLQLASEDVVVSQDQTLSVRFRKGKGVRSRGPYCVHTTLAPSRYRKRPNKWLEQRRQALFAGVISGPEIKDALRLVNPRLEQRSLRRGALQQLATSPGITDAILMEFSDTQVATLRRYINWVRPRPPLRCNGGWNLGSSVAAEPLGLRRAVLRTCKCTDKVRIFTDHAPLSWDQKKPMY